jgi:hypothetical protein
MDQNATGCKRTVEKFMNSNLIDEARNRAMDVLSRCYTPHGFRASALAAGYPHNCGMMASSGVCNHHKVRSTRF